MQTTRIIVRMAGVSDLDLLMKLGAKTFYETYIPTRPALKKDFVTYINQTYTEKEILKNLFNPQIIYLIAEINKTAAGYCRIDRQKSPEGKINKKWIKLEEIYVTKSMIGKGVGKLLMEEFLKIAKKEGNEVAWLEVWDGNQHAIDFYKKWGFKEFGLWEFKFGSAVDNDLLMKKKLEYNREGK